MATLTPHATITRALDTAEHLLKRFEADKELEDIGESLALIRQAKVTLGALVGVSVEDLRTRIAADIGLLRLLADEPVTVGYSRNVSLEICPINEADRINICHCGLGWTGVRYSGEGL